MTGKWWLIAAALAANVFAGGTNRSGAALWDRTVNLRGTLGYKDNVLLGKAREDGSAFWQTALDLMLLRLSSDATAGTFSFFATAEDRRYFSSEVGKEQLVLSQAKWEQPWNDAWSWGAVAQYMYADQVFDASATEELLQTLPVKSHNLQAAPFLARALPWSSRLELKPNLGRQYFSDPLDDYWEGGPQLTWTKKYGHRSEWTVGYGYEKRAYDTRRQFSLEGSVLPDTALRFDRHEFESSLTHVWDPARRWRSRARALYEINRDNGPGFYDYQRYRVSKRFGYYAETWEAAVEGKILHYQYARQPVPDGTELRRVWEFALAFRAEKLVWKKLRLFGETESEWVDSNYTLEEYQVNTVSGGFDWEF